MLVSSQTCCNQITNYKDWCSRVLQKLFVKRMCFLAPKLVEALNQQCAAFGVVTSSKAPGISSHNFSLLYNFPGNKITSLIFFL